MGKNGTKKTRLEKLNKLKVNWVEGNYGYVNGAMKVFCYTTHDLANLFGISLKRLRNMVSEGFNMGSLEEICKYYKTKEIKKDEKILTNKEETNIVKKSVRVT